MLRALFVTTLATVCLSQAAFAEDFTAQLIAPAENACQAGGAQLTLVSGHERVQLRQITAQTRTAARAMGFGGVSQYAVLPGATAMYRLPTNQPTFLLAAPSNIQPQGLFTLARFEPRPNGTREVLIGGGYMSYSSGILAERQVQLNARQAPSQAGAPAGTILYELTPAAPIPPGEYAMIVSIGAQGGGNPYGGAGMAGTFYDFGVD
jgi:hypothetical protein